MVEPIACVVLHGHNQNGGIREDRGKERKKSHEA
jgi:hypothetical protein